jgi:hypothetical protein
MDKLERYLDQVCRTIGGPRSLRQHVRQELREHLLDAASQHCTEGLSMSDALDRAIADFGGPEQVRAELEATHGHRFLAVVIDRAMQWKETTMRGKWLWATCANLAVFAVVVINILFYAFVETMFVPKLKKLQNDGWLKSEAMALPVMDWLNSSLRTLAWLGDHATWFLLAGIGLWGFFEWRVRGDNKSAMRMTVFGMLAVVLTIGSVVIASAIAIPFMIGMPEMARLTVPAALERVTEIESAFAEIEAALARQDWDAMRKPAEAAKDALGRLQKTMELSAVHSPNDKTINAAEQAALKAGAPMIDLSGAIGAKDSAKVTAALKNLREIGAAWK